MSRMSSWSRPTKSQATPAPFYAVPGAESTPYCRSCGRVISSRRVKASTHTESSSPVYCSTRCRNHKPQKLDREIENTFVQLLSGQEAGNDAQHTDRDRRKKSGKGDPRILVSCSDVEMAVFGDRSDPLKVFGRRKNRASRAIEESDELKSDLFGSAYHHEQADNETDQDQGLDVQEPYVDGDILARLSIRSGTRVRPAQLVSEVNGSVGGEKGWAERADETEEMSIRRIEGQKRAAEREMVRSAARRGVVFGFVVSEDGRGDVHGDDTRRKCEVVQKGKVVEPSFAKGEFSIRWREEER
ncbi:hypothetical protein F5Y18DRAFT_417908 [Xylariaceae sp. FL1019]|nr:hypothetical protein F5Y18DRAFT_417908 [Xylariaceae sp. FL1019]